MQLTAVEHKRILHLQPEQCIKELEQQLDEASQKAITAFAATPTCLKQVVPDAYWMADITYLKTCQGNGLAERMNGILKTDFRLARPKDLAQAQRMVGQSTQLYNTRRPHLALKYKTPDAVHRAFR